MRSRSGSASVAAEAIPVTPMPAPRASAPAARPNVILLLRGMPFLLIRRVPRPLLKRRLFSALTQR
jgi:hypothetical protein